MTKQLHSSSGHGEPVRTEPVEVPAAEPCDCPRPLGGPNADYFPNVVVMSHHNRRAWFYDELLLGRVALVNFMSIESDGIYPVTENLVKVQELLGDRLGRDVFMYSITTDPDHDSPRALRSFARRYSAKPGWLFLTGKAREIQVLKDRFFAHPRGHHQGLGPVEDCSLGLIRYGNESVGLWGAVPARTDPAWIVRRLDWVRPKTAPAGTPRRKGPLPQGWM